MLLENRICVVTACDNHFIILLAALIKSIEVTHKTAEAIDLYIVDDGINSKNKKRIIESLQGNTINIYWVSLSQAIPDKSILPVDNSTFPITVYARLFIPHFIPQDVKKVIYLDADMIFVEDISKLWNIEIGDHIVAGALDRSKVVSHWMAIINWKELNLDINTKYINSGLVVMNAEKWREENCTQKLLQVIKDNREYTLFPDQYALNVLFANQWFELDRRWNCISESTEKNPFLIHFIVTKPLFKAYNFNKDYQDKFYYYLSLTSWKNFRPVWGVKEYVKKIRKKINRKVANIFK